MRKLLASSLLLTLLSCASTVEFRDQHEDGTTKSEGVLVGEAQEGMWTYYWSNGNPKARGQYEGDTQVGPWTWWYENGNKRTEGTYAAEHKEGLWRHWYPDGTLWMTGWFDKGRKTGEWRTYAKSGLLSQRGPYAAGERTSLWTFYDDEGHERARGWFFEDTPVGPWETVTPQGERSLKTHALPEGYALSLECWEDGSPRRGGFVHEEQPSGRWLSWHENGEPRIAGEFGAAGPRGTWRAYESDGQSLGFGLVNEGRPCGAWKLWREGRWTVEEIDEVTRPPAIWSGEWSRSTAIEAGHELTTIEGWMCEMTSPHDTTDRFLRDLERAAATEDLEQLIPDEAPAPPPRSPSSRSARFVACRAGWRPTPKRAPTPTSTSTRPKSPVPSPEIVASPAA